MSESKLPADPLALVLGIISLLVSIGGCCLSVMFFPFALLSILPVIISIIGLVMANKSLKLYRENHEIYLKKSKDNVATAKVVNIITLVFGGLVFSSILIGFIYMGSSIYNFYDRLDQEGLFDKNELYKIDETDTIYDGKEYEYDHIETDTIETDTIETDSTILYEIKEIETIEN